MAKVSVPVASEMPGGGKTMTAKAEHRRPPKKHVKSIRTTRAKSGGHIVEHEYENAGGQYEPPAQHVYGKDEGVKHVKHYIRHAGIQGVSAEPTEGSAAEEAGESAAEEAGEGDENE